MSFITDPTVIFVMDCIKIGGIVLTVATLLIRTGKLLGKFKTIDVQFQNIEDKLKSLEKNLVAPFRTIDQRFENLDKHLIHRFDTIDNSLKEIKNSIVDLNKNTSSIDADLAKLEGAFEERGKWESKHSVGT